MRSKSSKKQAKEHFAQKKEQRQCVTYNRPPTRNERLKKLQAQIDFVHSLPTFYAAAWNSTAERSWDEPANAVRTCHFFRLPPELRITIYEMVLQKPYTVHLRRRQNFWTQSLDLRNQIPFCVGPSLLRTCKDIGYEALPTYFKLNKFVLDTALYAIDHAAKWIKEIIRLCGRNPFADIRFELSRTNWSELPKVEWLVHLLASGKLKLDTSGIDVTVAPRQTGSSQIRRLIMMKDTQGGMYVQRVIEEAMLIGTATRDQRWSVGKVSQQFGALIALQMPCKHLLAYKQDKEAREKRRRRGRMRQEYPA